MNYPAPPGYSVIISEDLFDHVFSSFPPTEMWKFAIDTRDHHKGKMAYDDTDVGYLNGVLKGIQFIRKNIYTKLSVEFITELHKLCVENVVVKGQRMDIQFGPKENRHIYYGGFKIEKCSPDAQRELFIYSLIYDSKSEWADMISKEEAHATFLAFYNHDSRRRISRIGWQPADRPFNERIAFARSKLTLAFERYYMEIVHAETPDERLAHIVRLVRYIEITHAFTDGNQRTSQLIFMKLLIENGFYPCILNTPSMFNGTMSTAEMVREIKESRSIGAG